MRKKKANIYKATVILRMKPKGEIIYGEGTVEAVKDIDGDALFIVRFHKELSSKPKGK